MSEVSREEAFNNIKTIINLWECDEEMFTDSIEISIDQEFINTMYKAISDMEKLQKIEEIVDEMWDENSYYNNTVRFAEKIEQIVRGE